MCRQAKKTTETEKWLGEIKHFCSLRCLMFFCSLQGVTGAVVKATSQSQATQSMFSFIFTWIFGSVCFSHTAFIFSIFGSLCRFCHWLGVLNHKCFTFFSLESCDVTLSTGATPVTSAVPQSTKAGTPVIASVVSLSNASNKQPGVHRNTDPKGD